jgi:uroporphyrinogen III methyltransferase/synthase
VPGITAGIAAPAYAGIPVTQRGLASAVALITAHEDPAKPEAALDWAALAAFPGTLVFYMGVRTLPALSARLIEAGRQAGEAAAVVAQGTLPQQRTVLGTLGTIAEQAASAGLEAPAITVIGAVAALHGELEWRLPGPLAGVTVAVTRARAQASSLAAQLRALGARAIEAPAIRVVPRNDELPALGEFDLVCLTSPNGVELLFERLAARGEDARALAGAVVAAIGPGTARALRERGVIADVVPERFVAEGLVDALAGVEFSRVLIARAAQARDVLPEALRERGASVEVVSLYETVAEPLDPAVVPAIAQADYLTFTSSSTVRFFLSSAQPGPDTRIVSIGPVTSATLRDHGLEVSVEAERHDIDGLVEAIVADHASRSTAE